MNTPLFMPPMMMIGISSAQKALPVACSRRAYGSGSPAGSTRSRSTSFHATMSPAPMIRPGTMPERNSAEIDVLVVTP